MRALNRRQRSRKAERRGSRLLRLVLGCILLVGGHVPKAAADIQVLMANETPYYRQTVDLLRVHLNRMKPGVPVHVHTGSEAIAADWPEADILVTIGAEALTALRTVQPHRVGLHLFITRDFWLDRQARDPELARRPGLVLDQPPQRLVALARAVLPDARTLAVVLGPVARRHLAEVQTSAHALGFEPLIGVLDAKDNPLAVLSPLVADADAVLVLPDRADFNGAVARWLLQLGFRARAPVIAFSGAYADAGAVAAVFTTPDDVSREAAELLTTWLDTGRYPEGARYPSAYSILTNPTVATTLNIGLPGSDEIRRRLETVSGGAP